MPTSDPDRNSPQRGHAGHSALLDHEGLATFRRAYRWLNLTLLQHGVWPLLVVVLAAPAAPVALTPLPWYWARLAAPLLATLLALAHLRQRPLPAAAEDAPDARGERERRLRQQATFLIVGLTMSVALLRLAQGPLVPVLKLEAFGLADAAAFQAISFGVAGKAAPSAGQALPVALFGLSWGLRDLFAAAASPAAELLALSFAGGAAVGLLFGAISLGLRRWPGGFWPATMFQFLIVWLTLGFVA
jgi:hypothetical protein